MLHVSLQLLQKFQVSCHVLLGFDPCAAPVQLSDDSNDFPWILIGAVTGGVLFVILINILVISLCVWRLSMNRNRKIYPSVVIVIQPKNTNECECIM